MGAIGGTYAYFSSSVQAPSQIKMAKVDIQLNLKKDSLKTYSMGIEQDKGKFENGGSAKFADIIVSGQRQRGLKLSLLSPGDSVKFSIGIDNGSNIAILYRISLSLSSDERNCPLQIIGASSWSEVDALAEIANQEVEITFPKESGNEYQNQEYEILIRAEAIQANAFNDLP